MDYDLHIRTLGAMLRYHRWCTKVLNDVRGCPGNKDGECVGAVFLDGYAETLKAAIECMERVRDQERAP